MDKAGSMQEQMGSKNREWNSKYQKEMLAIKNTVTKLKNAFGGLYQ